jgi:PAS domain S-box-containing protein
MNPTQQDLILIVDDDATNLKVLFRFLKESGFKVLVAQDGESAIEKLQEVSPDLILLDVMMPGIGGFETCHRLKASAATKDIPVIFMTVLSETVDKLKGLSLGAVDYITKPFQQEEVLARMRLHLKMRNLTKTLEEQNVLLKQEIEARVTAEVALQKLTQELEQRVQERTAQLANALHDLQQTQVQLLQSEALLRTVVTNAPIILYALNSEGTITLLEGKGLEALGQKSGQFVGQSAFELYRDYPELVENIRCGLSGKQAVCITQVDNVVYDNRATPVRDKNGQITGVIGVATDITQFKRSQEALSLSEKRFRLAVDHFPDTFVIYDANRRFQFVNAHGVRIGGVPESALLGHTDEEIHPPEIVDAYLPHLLKAVETRTSQTAECSITLPTVGKIIFVVTYVPLLDERGEIYQILGITHNITERKLAEEQLGQSEAQLRLALDAARMGLWDWNTQTGKITWSNNLERMFGLAPNTFDGRFETFVAAVHPEDRDCINQTTENSLETGQDGDMEFRIIRPDGSIRWLESKGQVFYDETGKPVRAAGINLDVSDRKLAEIQVRESLREKEVLLQEIHHRVKNNLQVISSLLDLQSQHIEEPATLELFRESCNRIRAMALVHETLYKFKDFAKIKFAEYIENLTSYLFAAYIKNVENINLELDIDEVTLKLDTAIPCGLIINELVSNALKYAFPNKSHGTIYITLHFDGDAHYTLTVRDDGIGLPPNLEIKNVNSLGLKLVEVLAKQLEGTLQVNSRFGTEFSLRFSERSLLKFQ